VGMEEDFASLRGLFKIPPDGCTRSLEMCASLVATGETDYVMDCGL
jgi:hypothetical protein